MQVFKNSRTALRDRDDRRRPPGRGQRRGAHGRLRRQRPRRRRRRSPSRTPPPAASSSTETVGDIYKRAGDSVVEITVTSAGQATPVRRTAARSRRQGSGFVYDTQGHVVTNQHVVDGAQSVSVKFANGHTYSATVVGTDPSTDLAVIDVDAPASALKPLELGGLLRGRGRRRRGRDRQPVRARPDGHDRHRQRAAPPDHLAEQLLDRRRDPDRRGDQPRQLRRPAARHAAAT